MDKVSKIKKLVVAAMLLFVVSVEIEAQSVKLMEVMENGSKVMDILGSLSFSANKTIFSTL
jgi:hypothetical protein